MAKMKKPSANNLAHAAWFLGQPKPAKNWFPGKGRCEDISPDLLPEEATGTAEVNVRAQVFTAAFCGKCSVRVECTIDMLRQDTRPEATSRGGMMPADTTRMWNAAKSIRECGGYEEAAAQLELPVLEVVPPDYIQSQPAPQPPLTRQ
jgi:hypothetical protein